MMTGTEYVVVRRAGEGWGVFLVSIREGRMLAAQTTHRTERIAAFSLARDMAGIWQVPLLGRDGLEHIAASEVEF